jgi:Rap1a immunity proteins
VLRKTVVEEKNRKASSVRIVLGFLVVFTAAVFTGPRADAQSSVDGNQLLHDCKDTILLFDRSPATSGRQLAAGAHCLGYVQGFLDTNRIWHAVDNDKNKTLHYCFDRDVTVEQVIRILVKYIQENPKETSDNGWECLLKALQGDFPCKA